MTAAAAETHAMCRNIRTLYNFDPPFTAGEVRGASLQFVRKVCGFTKPSKANEGPFVAAVDDVAAVVTRLLGVLETSAPPKNREAEETKAKNRARRRYGPPPEDRGTEAPGTAIVAPR
jgi:hypothetical protein